MSVFFLENVLSVSYIRAEKSEVVYKRDKKLGFLYPSAVIQSKEEVWSEEGGGGIVDYNQVFL